MLRSFPFIAALCLLAGLNRSAAATTSAVRSAQLGTVDFPVTGNREAQVSFLKGVAALHSFWYEEAASYFRETTRLDPACTMGYWGQAMTCNHPLWNEQDTATARKILDKMRDPDRLTPREQAYCRAVTALYGPGEKTIRDHNYMVAMERLHREFPDDREAAAFFALSLLGAVRPGDKGFRLQAQAAAIALELFGENPNHPGAAHYIIHAFDDPDHAVLALPAARAYAAIAPAAQHAQHMPSHIFLQLGMWPEAAAANERAWAVSKQWVEHKHLELKLRDHHSLQWLTYIYLQQGKFNKAHALFEELRTDIARLPDVQRREYIYMGAYLVIDGQDESGVGHLLEVQPNTGPPITTAGTGNHCAGTVRPTVEYIAPYVRSWAAIDRGAVKDITPNLDQLEKEQRVMQDPKTVPAGIIHILTLQIRARRAAAQGQLDTALQDLKEAMSREESLPPPSGPPLMVKPSAELAGEILLQAGRPQDARPFFDQALERHRNRSRSVLGLARTAARTNDRPAAQAAYTQFLQNWSAADPDRPEVKEARTYLTSGR